MMIYIAEANNIVCTAFVASAFKVREFPALPGSSMVRLQTEGKDNKQLQEGGVLRLKGRVTIWYVQAAQEGQAV